MSETFSQEGMSIYQAQRRMAEPAAYRDGLNLALDHEILRRASRDEFKQGAGSALDATQANLGSHLADEGLERYHLGKITDLPEEEALEQHLLICPACVDRANECASYIDAMREAAQTLQPSESHRNVVAITSAPS
jgi:hypothetical protein